MKCIELNCMGLKHPQPIDPVERLARVTPVSTVKVVTDDLTFEEDIKQWIENSNSNLIKLEKDGAIIQVQIEFEN
jgi:TusA-related sulfurtransferase